MHNVESGFSVLNLPLLSIYRSAYQHICQVLPSETTESGHHRRQKGKLIGIKKKERALAMNLSKVCHFHMIFKNSTNHFQSYDSDLSHPRYHHR